jgi:hypothetical protein
VNQSCVLPWLPLYIMNNTIRNQAHDIKIQTRTWHDCFLLLMYEEFQTLSFAGWKTRTIDAKTACYHDMSNVTHTNDTTITLKYDDVET